MKLPVRTAKRATTRIHVFYALPLPLPSFLALTNALTSSFPSPLFFLPRFNRQRAWLTKHARGHAHAQSAECRRAHRAQQAHQLSRNRIFRATLPIEPKLIDDYVLYICPMTDFERYRIRRHWIILRTRLQAEIIRYTVEDR